MGTPDIQFLQIYVAEAHAGDEWPIGSQRFDVPQAKTMQMRNDAAARLPELQGTLPWKVCLDSMDDRFAMDWGSWPTRFYILEWELVRYVSKPDMCAQNLHELEAALEHAVNGRS